MELALGETIYDGVSHELCCNYSDNYVIQWESGCLYNYNPKRLLYLLSFQSLTHGVIQSQCWEMLGIFVAQLIPCTLASLCMDSDSCRYPHTKPLGVPFLHITRQNIHPRSCAAHCSLTDGCIGVISDPRHETCRLYTKNVSFGITQDPDTILWLFQATGVPCIQVGWLAICIMFKALASVPCGGNVENIILKLIIESTSMGTYCEIALKWMPRNVTNDKSTLLLVMAWCQQATSHYLAPLLSNRISVIHGSRINYETICCPQFCTYSYQILCHVGGTSPPTWHKIW